MAVDPLIASHLAEFTEYGQRLDDRIIDSPYGDVSTWLISELLQINNKQGRTIPCIPNAAQRETDAKWVRQNIALKARQLGISKYVAARFFVDPSRDRAPSRCRWHMTSARRKTSSAIEDKHALG